VIDLIDCPGHVDRDADGLCLVLNHAGDRLADPPGRVRRQLVAAAVLELVDRCHHSDVAFLSQVEERQPATRVLLRNRDDEAQVRLDERLLGLRLAADDRVERVRQLIGRLCERVGIDLSVIFSALTWRRASLRSASLASAFLLLGFGWRSTASISRCTFCTESTACFISSISRRLTASVN
jgi:hypothetical protein